MKIQQKTDVATISRAYWLVEYHKKILDLTVGAPGSTHHAHCLSNMRLSKKKKITGERSPDKIVNLREELGNIFEVKLDDSASPHFPDWLNQSVVTPIIWKKSYIALNLVALMSSPKTCQSKKNKMNK